MIKLIGLIMFLVGTYQFYFLGNFEYAVISYLVAIYLEI